MSQKTNTPKKPVSLTLKEKLDVIKDKEQGISSRKLAVKYEVGKTQIQQIWKRKAEILELQHKASPETKRLKTTQQYEDINKLTYEWYLDALRRRVEISGPMLKEIALDFAKQLKQSSFTASTGWLDCFKLRNNIVYGKLSGESGDVDETLVSNWKDNLEKLTEGYEPRDIYNQDETALFFKTTQDKSFYTKGQKPGGAKKSKERVTVSLCANMVGDKEPITLIGKARRPRCFKNIDPASLPLNYRWNSKGWMTNDLFSAWLQTLNEKMKKEKRNILLFVDNAPSHKKMELSNISLRFLPPKTTSMLQPLDQGIIQAFKLQYRKQQYRHIVMEMERTEKNGPEIMGSVNILQAIMWADQAWKAVTPMTITKCFKKVGFQTESTQEEEQRGEEEDATPRQFNRLANEITGVEFSDLPTIEDDVLTENENAYNWDLPAAEILQQIRENETEEMIEEEPEKQEVETTNEPSTSEALTALAVLKDFFISKGMLKELEVSQTLDQSLFKAAQQGKLQKTLQSFGFKRD